MFSQLPRHEIVLLGVGHTHAHIVRMWKMNPIPDAHLTCISNAWTSTYSGMLPGVLAGLYEREDMEIDLARLCASAGVRLIVGNPTGLDLEQKSVLMEDRPAVHFDVLSIGIGSIPANLPGKCDPIQGIPVIAVKPMQTFLDRLDGEIQRIAERVQGREITVAIVGAGAAGVEIALCLPNRLKLRAPDRSFVLHLVDGGSEVLGNGPAKTIRRIRQELQSRGVRLHFRETVAGVDATGLKLAGGTHLPADLAIWTTNARGNPFAGSLGLATDDRGFLLTKSTLQVVSGAPIFAVGDSGTIEGQSIAKAGVYAVRQGPVLWDNLRRILHQKPLTEFIPQKSFLSALNLGDGRATISYKGMSFIGKTCWKIKDRIDRRFMAMYLDYSLPEMPSQNSEAAQQSSAAAMRCAGCGGKVAGSILSRVLAKLDLPQSPRVVIGLENPDDVAIVRAAEDGQVMATVDFFSSFMDDPYLIGRVAALNSLSDVYASGGRPIAALTMATIPVGPPKKQEHLLTELLAGGARELREAGVALVGGHTIESPQINIGFTVLADNGGSGAFVKSGIRPGQVLILTKPLGSGILLAAHMRGMCRADWLQSLIASLLQSNRAACEIARKYQITGMTDVTGFGFAGHLLEMLTPSQTAAVIHLESIPLYGGVKELVEQGVESTLAPANRQAEDAIEGGAWRQRISPQSNQFDPAFHARYRALFDPQTSGGILLGVPPEQANDLLAELKSNPGSCPAVVGQVIAKQADRRPIQFANTI